MLDLYDALQAPEDDDTEFLDDSLADDDTHEIAADDQRVTVNVPDNVTFESLVADSESLNSAGGIHFQVLCGSSSLSPKFSSPSCRMPGLISCQNRRHLQQSMKIQYILALNGTFTIRVGVCGARFEYSIKSKGRAGGSLLLTLSLCPAVRFNTEGCFSGVCDCVTCLARY
jgi:hypothetical protein